MGLLGFKGVMNPSPKVESSSEADPYLSHGGILHTFPALMEARLLGQLDPGLA